jgi:hypothetical protein
MKNECSKTRKVNEPYEIWANSVGWVWRVLKKYKNPEAESKDPYARWFCAVKSPLTDVSYDLGDVYVSEIKAQARKITILPPVIDQW